jgi:hypothetical protein
MVTPCPKTISPLRRKGRRVFSFPLRGRKGKIYNPFGNFKTSILIKCCINCERFFLTFREAIETFSFLPSSAQWNAEPIPPGSAEKRIFLLCVLCGLRERSERAVKFNSQNRQTKFGPSIRLMTYNICSLLLLHLSLSQICQNCLFLSFLRRQESSELKGIWTPASAGVTSFFKLCKRFPYQADI